MSVEDQTARSAQSYLDLNCPLLRQEYCVPNAVSI